MVYAQAIGERLASFFSAVLGVGLRVLLVVRIVAIGWIVATWLRRWLAQLLTKLGLDRVVQRGGLQRMLGRESASDLAARLVVFAFLLFVLQLAFGVFGPNAVSTMIAAIIAWLPRLFVAIILVVVAAAIAGWVKDLVTEALAALSYGRAIGTATQVLILVLGILAALDHLGVATAVTMPVLITALATVGGILVVGLGGGLIKPMQHRGERMLSRAETETTQATQRVRAYRAAAPGDRDLKPAASPQPATHQPPYGVGRPPDYKPEAAPAPQEPAPHSADPA